MIPNVCRSSYLCVYLACVSVYVCVHIARVCERQIKYHIVNSVRVGHGLLSVNDYHINMKLRRALLNHRQVHA